MKKLFSVFTNDLTICFETGSNVVAIHHIFYGFNNNRSKSEKYGFIVPIHPDLHNTSGQGIHCGNKELDLKYKKLAQTYYEQHYGDRKSFISEFGRSWL